jgi:2-iminobutanoate/2-iminopropanoate deaminase
MENKSIKKIIHSLKLPPAVGHYSQAVQAGDFLFLSGQIAIIPETGLMEEENIRIQTRRILMNIEGFLTEQNLKPQDVVKVSIFLKDMEHFGIVNELYAKTFTNETPARECIEVSKLPKNALIEMSLIVLCHK